MPKLSELIGGGGVPASGGRMKLSQVTSAPADFGAMDYPQIFGGTGFTPEFTEATGMSGLDAIPATMADMFGNYEDVQKRLSPSGRVIKDRDGIEVLEMPGGQRFRMNEKGLQASEAMAGFSRVGTAVAASRLLPGGMVLGGRILGSGGIAAGTDAALQKASGREDIDLKQTALSGALGAGGEALAPLVGAGLKKAIGAFRGDAPVIATGREIAKAAGYADDISDDVAKALGQRAGELKGGASPQSLMAEVTLGARLSRGQKTGDMAQLAREERLLSDPNSFAGRIMQANQTEQRAGLSGAIDDLRTRVGGANAPTSPVGAAERIAPAIKAERDAAKAVVDDAYAQMRSANATFTEKGVQAVPGIARQSVADFDMEILPAAQRSLAMLERDMVGPQSLQKISQIMTRLTNNVGAATSQADKTAAIRIKNAMQSWIDTAAETAVVQGDDAAIDLLKRAREGRAALGNTFENKAVVDKTVRLMAQGKGSPDELAQMMFGASNVSPKATATVAASVRKALGENPGAWDAFRTAVLLRATTNKAGEQLGTQAVSSNLKTLLRERPELVRQLFPKEAAMLGRVANAADAITPKGMMGRSSGTAERAMRFLSDMGRVSPMIGKLFTGPADLMAAYRALQPVATPQAITGNVAGLAAQSPYQ